MSDQDYKDDEAQRDAADDSDEVTDESTDTTPAGSYRLPGQDTSGFLGVDEEYKNSATPGGEAILTEEEAFLYLPAPEGDEDEDDEDSEDDDDESDEDDQSEESERKPVEATPEDERVQVNPGPTPARPIL